MNETERARRTFVAGALVAVAGLLAALALVYTNASGVGVVAEQAQQQQRIESALGAASSARNAVGQALLLAGSTEDPTIIAAGVAEAAAVTEALEDRISVIIEIEPDNDLLTEAMDEVRRTTDETLEALGAGELDAAAAIAGGRGRDGFETLVDRLADARDDLAATIATTAAQSGRVATASRFMVAFLVPAVAVIIAFIIARRRRKREALALELAQQRALNRSKDQLIANLSHELRTPLTGIYTTALTIEEVGFEDADLAMELTDVIIDQSADLTRMVEDLLVSAQADAGRLWFEIRTLDVVELCSSVAKELSRFPVDISWAIEAAEVRADPGRLRQLLRNLVSNGSKYGNGVVQVAGRVERGMCVIDVIDNGQGVPPEVEGRMFERFIHRGDTPLIVGSVGLGLSISRMLAEGMEGQLTYHRRDGNTVFEIVLPLATDDSDLPPDPSPTETPQIVDDEPATKATR